MSEYIRREAETALKELAESFPIVNVNGPRQSGKTTLVRRVFADKPYVNMESPDNRRMLADDARSFLMKFKDGAVIDEAQYAPEIFSWLQTIVDTSGRMGQFIITGSQNLAMAGAVSQSLAGRVAALTLLPFSHRELLPLQGADVTLEDAMFTGGYPPVFYPGRNPSIWQDNYIQTYIERDLHQMLNVKDLAAFQRFLAICAGRNAQMLNMASLSADCGISANTAKGWLSVLQASYIVFMLHPYYKNFNKRMVKAPKLYFYDTGLVCRLLGIQKPVQLLTHPLRGAIFESYAISEIAKKFRNSAMQPPLWYWRDSNGLEVDLLIDNGLDVRPVEIKSGRTYASDFTRGLKKWNQIAKNDGGTVIYGGDAAFEQNGCHIVSWRDAGNIAEMGVHS